MARNFLTVLAALGLIGAAAPAVAQTNTGAGTLLLHQLNRNPQADNTLSWREVDPAARARFRQLDTDHDGTLSPNEAAKGGITPDEFRQAHTKGTRTLSEQEYLGLVKMKFEAADRNHDQTLSSRELNSPSSQSLIKLLSTSS
jgi:EF hand